MKIGLRLESLGRPVRSALTEAARLGAAGVQLNAAGELAPDQLSQTGRREIRNLLRSVNLDLVALRCPVRRGLDEPEGLQPRLEQVRKVMTLSYDLGARVVIVDGPKIPDEKSSAPAATSPPTSPPSVPEAAGGLLMGFAKYQDPAATLREALADLGAYGDRIGTALALETGLSPGEKVAAYLKSVPSGALGVSYDPANMLLNGFDSISNLLPLRGFILHVQARDARAASPSRMAAETALGVGDLDWMTFLAVLESLEYRGWLVVDRESGENRRADVAHGIGFLKRFLR
jgi:sugar phosphate isomerase/epimerase